MAPSGVDEQVRGNGIARWFWEYLLMPPPEASRYTRAGQPRLHVRILHLNGSAFDALAAGDLTAANAASPVLLGDYFAGPDWRRLWRMRSRQARQDPSCVVWITGIIWDEDRRLAVGCAGFHAPPDAEGMAEIGYAVVPIHRRHGYARAAMEMLLERARTEPAVRKVRVTIAPENSASHNLAAQYGFTAVGEQWDDEDGLEIIYEVSASPS